MFWRPVEIILLYHYLHHQVFRKTPWMALIKLYIKMIRIIQTFSLRSHICYWFISEITDPKNWLKISIKSQKCLKDLTRTIVCFKKASLNEDLKSHLKSINGCLMTLPGMSRHERQFQMPYIQEIIQKKWMHTSIKIFLLCNIGNFNNRKEQ